VIGHVDGVIEPTVPALAQPVDLALAGGHLDRRGAVAGGEVVPAGKAGYVAGVADHDGGDDRADPEQPGQAGPGRGDGDRELLAGFPDPGIDPVQVIKEGRGQLATGRLHRLFGPDRPAGGRCRFDLAGHLTWTPQAFLAVGKVRPCAGSLV
jgi:hypothetical protein